MSSIHWLPQGALDRKGPLFAKTRSGSGAQAPAHPAPGLVETTGPPDSGRVRGPFQVGGSRGRVPAGPQPVPEDLLPQEGMAIRSVRGVAF